MTGYGGVDRSYYWQNNPPANEREISSDFQGGVLPNKAYLNIVPEKDTLDAHILSGMPYGRNSSEASKPTLEFPIYLLRESKIRERSFEKEYEEVVKNLKRYLSKELKEKFKAKNQNVLILGVKKALYYLSHAIVWLSESSLKKRRRLYPPFMKTMEENIFFEGKKLLTEGRSFLRDFNTDPIEKNLLQYHLKELDYILSQLSKFKNAKFVDAHLNSFAKEYELQNHSSQLQAIGQMIKDLQFLKALKELDPSLHGLLYTYHLSSTGSSIGETSISNEANEFFYLNLIEIAEETSMNFNSNGKKELLLFFFKSTIFLTILITSALIKSHYIPQENEEIDLLSGKNDHLTEMTNINFCCLECLIKVLLDFDLFSPFLQPTENKNEICEAFEAFILLLLLKFTNAYHPDQSPLLLFNLQKELFERISSLESIFNEKVKKKYEKAAAQLEMCHLNLKKNEFSSFFLNLNNFFVSLGLEKDENFQKIYLFSDSLMSTFEGIEVNNFTDFVHI